MLGQILREGWLFNISWVLATRIILQKVERHHLLSECLWIWVVLETPFHSVWTSEGITYSKDLPGSITVKINTFLPFHLVCVSDLYIFVNVCRVTSLLTFWFFLRLNISIKIKIIGLVSQKLLHHVQVPLYFLIEGIILSIQKRIISLCFLDGISTSTSLFILWFLTFSCFWFSSHANIVKAAVQGKILVKFFYIFCLLWSVIKITDVSCLQTHVDHEGKLGFWVNTQDETLINLF